MIARFRDVCLDANDPELVGRFWAAVLGREADVDADGDVRLRRAADGGPGIWVNRVPEPKTVKDRLHLDLSPVGCDRGCRWELSSCRRRPAGRSAGGTAVKQSPDPDSGPQRSVKKGRQPGGLLFECLLWRSTVLGEPGHLQLIGSR